VRSAGGVYSRYLEPIGDGFLVFAGLALLLVVPYLVWLYRRQGRVDPRRVQVAAAFLLFLVCAWALVLLPFPEESAAYCAQHTGKVQLVPFQWVADAVAEAQREGTGLRALLTNAPIVVRVFNLLLLLPLGVFLRRWWGRSLLATGLIALGLSLAFELTQVTAVWGLYPCPYRTFDVDDLIANTAGAMLGWWAAPAFRIIPERTSAAGRSAAPTTASLPRRLLATFIDYVLALLLGGLLVAAAAAALGLEQTGAQAARWSLPVGLAAVAVVWPVLTGSTPGQWFVLLRVRTPAGSRPSPLRVAVRAAVLWGPWLLAGVLLDLASGSAALSLAAVLVAPAWVLLVVALILRDPGRRGPHERASGTCTRLRDEAPASG